DRSPSGSPAQGNRTGRQLACRWHQQHRTRDRRGHGLDGGVGDRERASDSRVLTRPKVRDAETRDVEGGRVVAVAVRVVPTGGITTPEPATPVHRIATKTPILGRAVGPRGLAAARAGVTGVLGLGGVEADPGQSTLVAQQPPDLPANRRVVAPVTPVTPASA